VAILDQKIYCFENKTYIFGGSAKFHISLVPQIFGGPPLVRMFVMDAQSVHKNLGYGDCRRFFLWLFKKCLKKPKIRANLKRSKN